MNKRQKEVIQSQLNDEKEVLKRLEKQYSDALNDINTKIRILQSDELTQSRIYRIEHQKALKSQVSGILEKLHSDEYSTIEQFLKDSYTSGFIGTTYDLFGQGVSLIMPIDPQDAVRAVMTDSKISGGLYSALGVDVKKLKKSISAEISRGLASDMSYEEITRNIANTTKAPYSRARTIVQTETHRIKQAAALDAQVKAKGKGADVLKQWNSTLDGETRKTHRKLDGQIREVEEPFESDGQKAMFPGDFGDPAEDCNCRCVSLTRARWALSEEELETLKKRAAYFELDKTADFDDFTKKYLKAAADPTDYLWRDAATETNKIILDEITGYYETLNAKYGVKVDFIGDTLTDMQADWDMAVKWNAQDYRKNHPKVSQKQAESIVKRTQMSPRPESVNVMTAGTYWDDTTRIVYENGEYTLQKIKKININQGATDFSMTFKESEESIIRQLEKIEERRAAGRTRRLYLSNTTEGGAGTFIHEYGHALDFEKGIAEHPLFLEWYNTLTEDDICNGLSSYATENEREFIAEAFAESFFSYQRPMSKKFMEILNKILSEG